LKEGESAIRWFLCEVHEKTGLRMTQREQPKKFEPKAQQRI